MQRRVSWLLTWVAVLCWMIPAPLLAGGPKKNPASLETALTGLELEVKELKREVTEVKDLQRIVLDNAEVIDLELADLKEEVEMLSLGNAEMRVKIYAFLEGVNAAAEDGKILLGELQELNSDLKQLNYELCQLNCQLRQLNCSLKCLPDKIYKAKFRAFIFGVLVGVGIGAAIGGPTGAPGIVSAGVW